MSYSLSSRVYDAIYAFKDYAAEGEVLSGLISQYCPSASSLLDVACGTGKHLAYFSDRLQVEGLDLEPGLLSVARERLPSVPFHLGDMRSFNLGRRFDVVTCLFSAIGYVGLDELDLTVSNMARHLSPGGVLIIEPWFTPDAFHPDTLHAQFVNEPDLKVARMNISRVEGRRSVLKLHHLVGTLDGIEHFVEDHLLTMFTHEEYMKAFQRAGLETHFDEKGLLGRGLYIGVLGA